MSRSDLQWLRPIEFSTALEFSAPVGSMAEMKVLQLSRLVIDPRYQRDIGGRGRKNIRHIVEHFDWALFTPVVVVPVEGGCFAIVDGQHRATAAMMHPQITSVPCAVMSGDFAAQARAFVGINDRVTRLNGLQIFVAELAAGDAASRDVAECCKAAGVTVPGYPIPRDKLKKGYTLAIGAIKSSVATHGKYKTALAMSALAAADADGLGLVNRDTILGLVGAVVALGQWAKDNTLFLSRMATLDLEALDEAATLARLKQGGTVAFHFNRMVISACTDKGWGPSLAPSRVRRGVGSY